MFESMMQFIIKMSGLVWKIIIVEQTVYSAVDKMFYVSCYITCIKCSRYFVLLCCCLLVDLLSLQTISLQFKQQLTSGYSLILIDFLASFITTVSDVKLRNCVFENLLQMHIFFKKISSSPVSSNVSLKD